MAQPLHHAQIVRTLPTWSKMLHPKHVSQLMGSLRTDYLDTEGKPYAWFSQADAAQQQALRSAIEQRDAQRRALQGALAPLKGVVEYCQPLLQARLGDSIAVTQACYVHQPYQVKQPVGSHSPIGAPPPRERRPLEPQGKPSIRTLLEAALHNFTGVDDIRSFDRLQRSATDIQPLPGLRLPAFIEHCRQLDLGKAYQTHLAEVLDASKAPLERRWADAQCAELNVHARIAHLRGQLGDSGLAALEQLCSGASTPHYEQRPLHCWRLSLESFPLHELLLIGPEGSHGQSPIIVYLPGAENGSLREYASRAEAARDLRQQLSDSHFRQRIVALAPQPQQAALARALRARLYHKPDTAEDIRANAHIEFSVTRLPIHPWAALYGLYVQRLKGDARAIAVPTADVDAKARLALLEHWLDIGLTALNVAAMFVPGLNPLMLAIGAAQLMGSVFHGIEAWEEGDSAEALAQVESILLNLVTVAGIAGAGAVFRQSGFVDAMCSVWDQGKERLWAASLDAYRSMRVPDAYALPDAQGFYATDDYPLLRIENDTYEVVRDDNGQWRLQHPTSGYPARLRSNGQGAWRLHEETPLDWSDVQLLRRFGPPAAGLDDADLTLALHSTGTQADALRYAHVNHQPAPGLLADTLVRLSCDREASAIIATVRQGRPLPAYKHYAMAELPQLPGWPQDYVLTVYEGPEPWGTSTSYAAPGSRQHAQVIVTRSDLVNGKLSEVVLQQLDDQARLSLRGDAAELSPSTLDQRLADHLQARRERLFTSLYQQRQPELHTLATPIARQFPGIPALAVQELAALASASERERLGMGRVPLRLAEEARLLQRRARLDRALIGIARPNLASEDSLPLSQALLAEHPGATLEQRLQAAWSDRDQTAALIGQQPLRPGWRSPFRISEGRLGYPLSGRPRWYERIRNAVRNIADERLQALYPSLTAAQRRERLAALRQRGNVGEQLTALEREQQALDASLRAWQDEAGEPQHRLRGELRQQLARAWRREGTQIFGVGLDSDTNMLELGIEALQSLPERLPARFDHITMLHIHGGALTALPAGFLQSFPGIERLRLAFTGSHFETDSLFRALRDAPQLRELVLPANRLQELSDQARLALGQLRRLRHLDLSRNALSLTTSDLEVFANLPLEQLLLSGNRIVLSPDMAARFARMGRLQGLDLSFNPELGEVPHLAGMLQLQSLNLSHCGLTQWPSSLGGLLVNPANRLWHVQLNNNHITDIPNIWQVLSARAASGRDEELPLWHFEMNYNQLRPEIAQRLREAGAYISEETDFLPEPEAVDWLAEANADQRRTWHDLFDQGENGALREVIERLGRSAQAQGNPRALAAQVWRLLVRASEDTRLRERLEQVAAQFPATCGDAGADGFSTLEVEMLAHDESAEAEVRGPYLFNFYRRLFRREQVNVLASRIHASRLARQAAYRAWLEMPSEQRSTAPELPPLDALDDLNVEALQEGLVDDIEIRLALRQALADDLEYPEPSQDMLYWQTAQISPVVEQNVEDMVRQIDHDAAARRGWIARQPGWKSFLEQRFAERFKRTKAQWEAAQEFLDHGADPSFEAPSALAPDVVTQLTRLLSQSPLDADGSVRRLELDSQRYDQASRAVASAREAALDALYAQLTAEQDPNHR